MEDVGLISVVLCIYKEPQKYVEEAVQSILNQTYKNFELIIVIDDPQCSGELNDYLLYIECDERVVVMRNDVNCGIGQSRANGIDRSRGSIIALMDADDISIENRFEKEIMMLNYYDVVSTAVEYIDSDGNSIETYLYSFGSVPDKLPYCDVVFTSTVMMLKSAYIEAGGYRDLRIAEDYDLWLRMLLLKKKFGVINIPLLKYRKRQQSLSHKDIFKSYLIAEYLRKKYRLAKKGDLLYEIDDLDKYLKINYKMQKKKKFNNFYAQFTEAKRSIKRSQLKGLYLLFICMLLHPYYTIQRLYWMIRMK